MTVATREDLALLAAAVELTERRVNVAVADAWRHLCGRAPSASEWIEVRFSIARLEREALVRFDADLHLEPTDDGRRVVESLDHQHH
jgi:hypothetical protein